MKRSTITALFLVAFLALAGKVCHSALSVVPEDAVLDAGAATSSVAPTATASTASVAVGAVVVPSQDGPEAAAAALDAASAAQPSVP